MASYTMEKTERDWDICYNAFKKDKPTTNHSTHVP